VDNPGPRGGPQSPHSELNEAIARYNSAGPDLMDQNRSANALVHDDTAGAERMYLQAQMNFYETVKADMVGSVGGNRVFTVLHNDTTLVGGFEVTEVGRDRTVAVGGKQAHVVTGDINVQGMANMVTVTPRGAQVHLAQDGLVLRAGGDGGSASILIFPDAIIIDAPKTYINPGPAMMASIYAGRSVEQAARDQESEDRIQRATQAMREHHDYIAAHTFGRGYPEAEQILRSGARTTNGSNPFTVAAQRAVPGITREEIRQAEGRAANLMYPHGHQ
jgi:hypothetical protein